MKKVKSLALVAVCSTVLSLAACTSDTPVPGESSGNTPPGGAVIVPDSIAQVLANSLTPDFSDDDLAWDAADEITVTLSDAGSTGGAGVSVAGSTVTITQPGTYRLSGSLSDGQLAIESSGLVRLVLDQVTITNSRSSALLAQGVDKLVIITADGTQNTLTDATDYLYPDDDSTEPDAALFSKSDLVLGGSGELAVNGRFADGIVSKDGLVIAGGTVAVSAADDGIRGRDYLVISGGEITIDTVGQGLKSTNDSTAGAGYIMVNGGTIGVTTTGQSSDCLNAVSNALFTAGTLTLACTDDGIHADKLLMMESGDLTITQSYEGLESAVVVIAGGSLDVTSRDDGINATDGSGSGGGPFGQQPGGTPGGTFSGPPTAFPSRQPGATPSGNGPGNRPSGAPSGGSGTPGGARGNGGGPGRGGAGVVEAAAIVIGGGAITLDAEGDGIDSNGTAVISDGLIIIYGPTRAGNGALDVNGAFQISGGTVAAIGSASMVETPDETSPQPWFSQNITINAGDTIAIATHDSSFGFVTVKPAQNIVFSSPDLASGDVTLTVGDAAPVTPECHGG